MRIMDKLVRIMRNEDCDTWFVVVVKDGVHYYDMDFSMVKDMYECVPEFKEKIDGITGSAGRAKADMEQPRKSSFKAVAIL